MQKNKIYLIKHYLVSLCVLFFCIYCSSCASSNFASNKDYATINDNLCIEYQNIADTYVSQEKYDKAISYYELALENKTTYWNVYYKLAKAYALQKSWLKAEEMFIKLLERDPENSTLKVSLAYIYSMNGKLDIAKSIYIELINSFPEVREYLENYISILIVQKEYDLLLTNLNILTETFPDSEKITLFKNEYDKYLKEQDELNQTESSETENEESDQNNSETLNNNEITSVNKNPEESNLEIENISDDE